MHSRKEVEIQIHQALWVNKYTYDPRNLLLAYGSVVLLTPFDTPRLLTLQ
jgi:hypothetical protein